MAQPIGPQPPPQPIQGKESPVELAHTMQSQVLTLAKQLQELLHHSMLSADPHFLQTFATNGKQLQATVEQAIQSR